MADLYSEIPKGLRALGEAVTVINETSTTIAQKVAEVRARLQKADRTDDVLRQIENLRARLQESQRALSSVLEAIGGKAGE